MLEMELTSSACSRVIKCNDRLEGKRAGGRLSANRATGPLEATGENEAGLGAGDTTGAKAGLGLRVKNNLFGESVELDVDGEGMLTASSWP